jgi:hypothetical protein
LSGRREREISIGAEYGIAEAQRRVLRRSSGRDAGHSYGCAVSNMVLNSTSDLFALPRLTIRRSVAVPTFQEIVRGRVPMMLWKDRALTKGWAMVRRTRQRWMR